MTFDDDDEDDVVATPLKKKKNVGKPGFNQFAGAQEAPVTDFDKLVEDAFAGPNQKYNVPLSGELNVPKLRPKNTVPQVREAFAWAGPDKPKKGKGKGKGKKQDMLGLSNKQRKQAIAIPGMTPLFDFLNVYRTAKGGWR